VYLIFQHHRFRAFLFFFFMLGLASMTGCLNNGGSPSSVIDDSPELAVRSLLSEWESQDRPLVAQTSGETASQTITFRDILGKNSWTFTVVKVEYPVIGLANVYTTHQFQDSTATIVNVKFQMVKFENRWVFDNFTIETLPTVVVTGTGVQGYIRDAVTNQPVQNAAAGLYQGDIRIAETLTDANGYYFLQAPAPGIYTVVVAKDGYEFLNYPNVTIN